MSLLVRNAGAALLAAGAACLAAACANAPTGAQPPLPAAGVFAAGATYTPDANRDVEYFAGNLPLVFTAPHGGTDSAGLPARAAGEACGATVTSVRDRGTAELALAIRAAFLAETGRYPHVVVSRLHRSRMDANRDLREAACGDARAGKAWRDYHAYVDAARARVVAEFGTGWYTDLHGHGHPIDQLELGYALSAETLRRADADLDAGAAVEQAASFRVLSEESPLAFSALLRGPTALGTLLANAGFASVPSLQKPAPASGESYFSGGYSTDRHACSNGGRVCGVQIESHYAGVRDTDASRARFARALVSVYRTYLGQLGIAF